MCVINGLKVPLYLARRCKIFFDNLSRSAGLENLMYFYETESLDKMATKLCIKFSPLLVILWIYSRSYLHHQHAKILNVLEFLFTTDNTISYSRNESAVYWTHTAFIREWFNPLFPTGWGWWFCRLLNSVQNHLIHAAQSMSWSFRQELPCLFIPEHSLPYQQNSAIILYAEALKSRPNPTHYFFNSRPNITLYIQV